MRPRALSIVVPAYNEQARVAATLDEMITYCRQVGREVEILVVDDGSEDRTPNVVNEVASQFPEVRLIRLDRNRGKGFAVRVGMLEATGTRVIFADADGATPIAELQSLESALDDGADIAIGSRAIRVEGVKLRARWYRRVIGRIFHGFVSLIGVRGFADTQCGFKLFTAHSARAIFSRACVDRFAFDIEVLLIAVRLGYRVVEVPVNWNHKPGSRINLLTDSARMLFDVLRIRLSLLGGVR